LQVAQTFETASPGQLCPASTIRCAEIDGCCVILDLATERYRVLDEVASGMWSALTASPDSATAIESMAARYDVARSTLEADLSAFADTCVREGLLISCDELVSAMVPEPVVRHTKKPTVLGALGMLYGTHRALARDGFRVTYERVAQVPPGTDATHLPLALAKFLRAENLFIHRNAPADCLHRSLSLYRFLQSCNIPAGHRIGVDRFPFQAHAWVEHDGMPLLDERGREMKLTPLAWIGAA
jgi:hypothetical protein